MKIDINEFLKNDLSFYYDMFKAWELTKNTSKIAANLLMQLQNTDERQEFIIARINQLDEIREEVKDMSEKVEIIITYYPEKLEEFREKQKNTRKFMDDNFIAGQLSHEQANKGVEFYEQKAEQRFTTLYNGFNALKSFIIDHSKLMNEVEVKNDDYKRRTTQELENWALKFEQVKDNFANKEVELNKIITETKKTLEDKQKAIQVLQAVIQELEKSVDDSEIDKSISEPEKKSLSWKIKYFSGLLKSKRAENERLSKRISELETERGEPKEPQGTSEELLQKFNEIQQEKIKLDIEVLELTENVDKLKEENKKLTTQNENANNWDKYKQFVYWGGGLLVIGLLLAFFWKSIVKMFTVD